MCICLNCSYLKPKATGKRKAAGARWVHEQWLTARQLRILRLIGCFSSARWFLASKKKDTRWSQRAGFSPQDILPHYFDKKCFLFVFLNCKLHLWSLIIRNIDKWDYCKYQMFIGCIRPVRELQAVFALWWFVPPSSGVMPVLGLGIGLTSMLLVPFVSVLLLRWHRAAPTMENPKPMVFNWIYSLNPGLKFITLFN